MGHNNYSKFSKQSEPKVYEEPITETEVNTEVTVAEETPIVEEVITAGLNQVEENVQTEETESTVNEVNEESSIEGTIGIVSGAERLYVRKEPVAGSDAICTINKDSKVQIDLKGTEPENDFYKVVTSEGIEGYCMKKFINIK